MHKLPESRHRSRLGAAAVFAAPLLVAVVAGACAGPTRDPAPRENVAIAQQNLVTCVTIQRGTFGTVEDATIATNVTTPDWNTATLRAGGQFESLLWFDVGSIPANASVNSATLSLTTTNTVSGEWLFANVAAAPWSESTVTFASFDQQLGKSAGIMTPSAANTVQTLSVQTRRVQGWVNGTLPNYGIVLQTMVSMPSNYKESAFISSESPVVSLRPALEICYTPFDYCAGAPCQNGATCQSNATGYTCACAPGFTGTSCEINIDDCAGNPCQNGGACTDGVNGYTCACAPGYAGANCETDINECAPAPCQNGGVCSDLVNGYSCACPPGFTGTSCEIDIDECAGNPCQNGGTCTDGVNGYTCACAPGFAGAQCQTNIDDCAGNACQNGSTCVDGAGSYTCACAPGFTGAYCEIDVDDCAGNPCQNGGTCADGVNGYTCACAPGYTGTNCQIDINECAPQPCQNGGTCIDGINGFTCQCAGGWMGALCDVATSSAPATIDVVPGAATDQVLTAPGMQVVVPAGVDVQVNGAPVTGSVTLSAQLSADPSEAYLLPSSDEESEATGQVMPDSRFTVFPTYHFGPSGATFNPPLQATLVVPSGISEPAAYLCDDDGTNCQMRAGIFYQDTSVSPPQTKLYIEIDHFSVLVLTGRSPSGISYLEGPVMRGTPNIYYIWYGDWAGNSAPTILTDLAQNLSGSPYMAINTAYSDGSGNVSGNVSYGGSVSVAASTTYGGLYMSDTNIRTLVQNSIGTGAGKLPLDANGIYFVLTAPNVTATSGFCTRYCGWHNYTSFNGTNIKYSFVGNAATQCPNGCIQQSTSPNGNAGADGMASTLVHEIVETLTDPELAAWRDASGNENADKCAWNFGATSKLASGAQYNVTLGARKYLLQRNWDPVAGACALSAQASAGFPAPDGTPCDDGNACTLTDTVQAGVCVGHNPKVCSAPDQCHLAGVCNPSTGACSSVAKSNGAACNDGNSATPVDTCQNGVCVGSAANVVCGSGACQVLSATPQSSSSTPGCQTYTHKSAAITRSSGTPLIWMSGNAAGTQAPDFDELAVVTVTSPTKQVKKLNLVHYEPNCSDTSAPTVQLPGSGAAVDITSLFGSEFGTFIVDIDVRGFGNPYSWSNTYLVTSADLCAGVVCAASTCPAAVGWWSAEGNAVERTGRLSGTASSGVTYGAGMAGQAFVFNGSSDVRVPDSPLLTLATVMTLEAWINYTGPNGALQDIISKNRGTGGGGYELRVDSNGKVSCGLNNSANNFSLAGATTLPANQWVHVACTRNGNVVKVYVNGVLDGSSTTAFTTSMIDSTLPLTIGSGDTVGGRFFKGKIDEAAVYATELTAAEISAVYGAGATGKCKPSGTCSAASGACTYAATSCQDILSSGQSTGTGTYTLDPDGAGGNAAFQAYCDMVTTGGGWTLIQSHVAGTYTSATPVTSVGLGSRTVLSPSLVQALANVSASVRLDDTSQYVESIDSYPITQLRSLAVLNDDATMGTPATHWSGTGLSHLSYICTSPYLGYPQLYWSCGNGSGLHILPGNPVNDFVHGFSNNSTALNVWVR